MALLLCVAITTTMLLTKGDGGLARTHDTTPSPLHTKNPPPLSLSSSCAVCKTFRDGLTVRYCCMSRFASWWRDVFPTWERDVLAFLAMEKVCVVSFGEWIGPTMIPILRKTRLQYALILEPDPIAFSELVINMQLNNVEAETHMACVNLDGSVATLRGVGISGSSLVAVPGSEQWIPWLSRCVALRHLLQHHRQCTFKIDVEGYEEQLVDQLVEAPPARLSLSVHHGYLKNATVLAAKLTQLTALYPSCVFTTAKDELLCQ